jgi:hypothetical protein
MDTVASSAKPVSTGMVVVKDAAEIESTDGGKRTYPFQAYISECWKSDDKDFGSWPRMQPSNSYFVVLAVASSDGNLNPALVGTIASTL